jgi:hypothetical protein
MSCQILDNDNLKKLIFIFVFFWGALYRFFHADIFGLIDSVLII